MDGRVLDSALIVREDERIRLARQLEMRLGRSLNFLSAQANTYQAVQFTSVAQARQALRTLAEVAARTLTDFQDLTMELSPSDLRDLGLNSALETLVLRVEQRYGLMTTLDLPDATTTLPSYLLLPIYRISQEALYNVGEHARAGRVGLSLRVGADDVRLTLADDGEGFDPPEPLVSLEVEGKRGLVEMVERAVAIGGRLDISSVVGVGTQVRAYLPLVAGHSGVDQEPSSVQGGANARLLETLTPRERDVLSGVTAGLTDKQIAVRLGISDRTVQFHLGNVLGKLGVASRTEAAVLALQKGLIQERET